jgi:hypothetical protein
LRSCITTVRKEVGSSRPWPWRAGIRGHWHGWGNLAASSVWSQGAVDVCSIPAATRALSTLAGVAQLSRAISSTISTGHPTSGLCLCLMPPRRDAVMLRRCRPPARSGEGQAACSDGGSYSSTGISPPESSQVAASVRRWLHRRCTIAGELLTRAVRSLLSASRLAARRCICLLGFRERLSECML